MPLPDDIMFRQTNSEYGLKDADCMAFMGKAAAEGQVCVAYESMSAVGSCVILVHAGWLAQPAELTQQILQL